MSGPPIPLRAAEALDRYFYEMRHKLIDIAAGLDRIQRCDGGEAALSDYRIVALRAALEELKSAQVGRVERVQLALSDPTRAPLPAAPPGRATGAYDPQRDRGQP